MQLDLLERAESRTVGGWRAIDTAAKDTTKSLQLGRWQENRWAWLTHGAWSEQHQSWMTDEPVAPTHWREIGTPDADITSSNRSTK